MGPKPGQSTPRTTSVSAIQSATTMLVPILVLILVAVELAAGFNPVPHQTDEETLRNPALGLHSRKTRSTARDDYDYRQEHADHSFEPSANAMPEEPPTPEPLFLAADGPILGPGRYQHYEALEKFLENYSPDENADRATRMSMFRERERTGSRKRGNSGRERPLRISDEVLSRLEGDDGDEYDNGDGDDEFEEENNARDLYSDDYRGYMNAQNSVNPNYYSSYGGRLGPRVPMAFDKYGRRIHVERRNANTMRFYRPDISPYLTKRFAVSKRSALDSEYKSLNDPKVAKSLESLFGSKSTSQKQYSNKNLTDNHGVHNHDEASVSNHSESISKSKAPKKATESKESKVGAGERPIQIQKKSIKWDDYVGYDRRKKSTGDRDSYPSEYQDWLQRTVQDLILTKDKADAEKDGLRYRDEDEHPRFAGNYRSVDRSEEDESPSEQLSPAQRKELYERVIAARMLSKIQKTINSEPDEKMRAHINSTKGKLRVSDIKRNIRMPEIKLVEPEDDCPELDQIENHCRSLFIGLSKWGSFDEILRVPCVKFYVCNACGYDETCLDAYLLRAVSACRREYASNEVRDSCLMAVTVPPRRRLPIDTEEICTTWRGDVCSEQFLSLYAY